MDNFTNEELYGSIEDVFKFTELDKYKTIRRVDGLVELLKIRLDIKLNELGTTDPLITAIYQKLEEKKKNRLRYLEWMK